MVPIRHAGFRMLFTFHPRGLLIRRNHASGSYRQPSALPALRRAVRSSAWQARTATVSRRDWEWEWAWAWAWNGRRAEPEPHSAHGWYSRPLLFLVPSFGRTPSMLDTAAAQQPPVPPLHSASVQRYVYHHCFWTVARRPTTSRQASWDTGAPTHQQKASSWPTKGTYSIPLCPCDDRSFLPSHQRYRDHHRSFQR